MRGRDESEQTNQNNALSNFGSGNTKKKLFGKINDGTSKKDRLNDLLQKVEEYSRFILRLNINAHNANLRKKNAGEQENGAQNSNLKGANAKRRAKKNGKA